MKKTKIEDLREIYETIQHDSNFVDKLFKDSEQTIDLLGKFKSIDKLINLMLDQLEFITADGYFIFLEDLYDNKDFDYIIKSYNEKRYNVDD